MTSEHEYTPTEDEWRDATTYSLCDWWERFETTDERDLAWARFIAQVKAEAWDEGYWQGGNDVGSGLRENELTPNPYLEEGDQS